MWNSKIVLSVVFSHVYIELFFMSQDMNGDLDENIYYGFLELMFLGDNYVLINDI